MTNATSINADRAQWARSAVDHFAKETGADVYSEAISNLICNLGHLCDELSVDFTQVVAKATGVWKMQQVDPAGVTTPPRVSIQISKSTNWTDCQSCGGILTWQWEEAFDKFGFGDGDGQVMTDVVVGALNDAGYTVQARPWGMHNEVIVSIRDDNDQEVIPTTAEVGYDDPRTYLPPAIIELLDRTFAANSTGGQQ